MDDGSHSVAESVSMMEMLASQGIDIVVATPHFYANDETVDSFLQRRKNAYEMLKEALPENSPKLILGAEVRYYQGISRMENLKALRVEGTKVLLLEMPMTVWTEYMVRELVEMAGRTRVKVVLAHVERYLQLQKGSTWDRLFESGILMQTNASFYMSFLTKRKALSLLDSGKTQLVGSDCHNVTTRPPRIGSAYNVISEKLGHDFINQMNDFGNYLLEELNN